LIDRESQGGTGSEKGNRGVGSIWHTFSVRCYWLDSWLSVQAECRERFTLGCQFGSCPQKQGLDEASQEQKQKKEGRSLRTEHWAPSIYQPGKVREL
jgi:hypothetical protein